MDQRIAWWIFFATIPAAIAGAIGESSIENHLGQPWQIAVFMAVFAVLLWLADRLPQERQVGQLGFWPAFAIGVSQILALMPGVSRSGITITTGRFFRLNRDAAARFAFLLLIPIVFGAVVYKGLKHVVLNPLPAGSTGPFIVGTLAAAAVGLVAIDLLLGYVRRHDYTVFVIYRLLVAAGIVIVIASGWRGAHFWQKLQRKRAGRRTRPGSSLSRPVLVVETEREEIHMRLPRRRLLLVALPLVLVTGVALAAQPGGRRPSNAVINACVKKKDGRVRIVAAAASCRRNELAACLEQPGIGRAGRSRRPGRRNRARPVRPARKAIRAHAAQPERQGRRPRRANRCSGPRRACAQLAREPERGRLPRGRPRRNCRR